MKIEKGINVRITVIVIKKKHPQKVNVKGKELDVCNYKVQYDNKDYGMVVWGKMIQYINEGDKVFLNNCYVDEYLGELQFTAGRDGNMVVIEEGGD